MRSDVNLPDDAAEQPTDLAAATAASVDADTADRDPDEAWEERSGVIAAGLDDTTAPNLPGAGGAEPPD